MTFLDALILGVIEGLSEFLPISSTGHLILASHLLRLEQTEVLKSFEIAIQLGAILAVVLFAGRKHLADRGALARVGIAFLPTAIVGFFLHGFVKEYLLANETVTLAALLFGGIVIVLFEWTHNVPSASTLDVRAISWKQALAIGCFQSVALIPGTSRSAATIIGGLLLGLPRTTIVGFSFLLAIPTMLAATTLDLAKTGWLFSRSDGGLLLVGFVTSFIVALVSIRWLLSYIQRHSFVAFGVYRILFAVAFWMFLL